MCLRVLSERSKLMGVVLGEKSRSVLVEMLNVRVRAHSKKEVVREYCRL